MRKRKLLATTLHRSGGTWLLDRVWGADRLTVLGYHRICDAFAPHFDGYEPNVSATPAMFARQMDFVRDNFNVIDLQTLHAFVVHKRPLPPRPLLITFDDGYLDNYENAYPILRERNLPAVIFIVSDWGGSSRRAWWDQCAYFFHHTTRADATLPLVGQHDLSTANNRRHARELFIQRIKTMPELEKREHLAALARALDVTPPREDRPLFVSWDQTRDLVANGIACQPHTTSHPILTRISPERAQHEIQESAARLAGETGQVTQAFAYPNGTIVDYTPEIMGYLRDLDIPLAFTLTPGPLRLSRVRQHALEIPRVFLSCNDSFDVFVVKVMGVPALLEQREFHA